MQVEMLEDLRFAAAQEFTTPSELLRRLLRLPLKHRLEKIRRETGRVPVKPALQPAPQPEETVIAHRFREEQEVLP